MFLSRAANGVRVLFRHSALRNMRLGVRCGPKKKGSRSPATCRRSLTEDEQHKLAHAVVEHLEPNNWKIEKGEPVGRHGSNPVKQFDNNARGAAN